jgi:hypothetical protein
MSESIEIKILIAANLFEYFAEGIQKRHIEYSTTEEITRFLAMILNDSMYPIAVTKTGDREIQLSYRPRAFADPIF